MDLKEAIAILEKDYICSADKEDCDKYDNCTFCPCFVKETSRAEAFEIILDTLRHDERISRNISKEVRREKTLLRFIEEGKNLTQTAHEMHISKATASRILNRMMQGGRVPEGHPAYEVVRPR